MNRFKFIALILSLSLFIVACGKSNEFSLNNEIIVVTREDGSGTRGAFVEITGIELKENGTRKDRTTKEAITLMKTDNVITTVAGNPSAIGYISTGSLNDTIKTLAIEGVQPTTENIASGEYKIARPFKLATKSNSNELVNDFINFILSKEGQDIVSSMYTPINNDSPSYISKKLKGKIVVAGSSSVTPIMEKLKEGYLNINSNIDIEIHQSDSSSGMQAVTEGNADIGMASRDLKESEKENLQDISIALDGIAIIVNPLNTFDDISLEDVKNIFMGQHFDWNSLTNN